MTKPEDIITFGKYKGKTFDEIADIEPSYILWLKDNIDSVKLPKNFLEAVEWDVRWFEEDMWYAIGDD